MEQDKDSTRYLLHLPNSWEREEKLSHFSTYINSYLQRRERVKVNHVFKVEDEQDSRQEDSQQSSSNVNVKAQKLPFSFLCANGIDKWYHPVG